MTRQKARDSKREDNEKKDISWKILIEHAKAEIIVCQKRIYDLRKSLIFFNKQAESGIPFPLKNNEKPQDLS